MNLRKFWFLLLVIFSNIYAQPDYYNPANRKLFADYLYEQKDYLRAFDEYKIYLQNTNNDTVKLKLGEMFIEVGRYSEAEDYLKMLFWGSNLDNEAKLNYYLLKFKTLKPIEFRSFVRSGLYFPEKYKENVTKLEQISYFYDNYLIPDSSKLFETFYSDSTNFNTIKTFYHNKFYPQKKDPVLAGVLSAIVPGMGKIYTKNYSDGITAFIVNGVLAYLAYDNFKANHDFRGAIFSGLGLMFYAGNIYGSIASAHSFNIRFTINSNEQINTFFNNNNYFIPKF